MQFLTKSLKNHEKGDKFAEILKNVVPKFLVQQIIPDMNICLSQGGNWGCMYCSL